MTTEAKTAIYSGGVALATTLIITVVRSSLPKSATPWPNGSWNQTHSRSDSARRLLIPLLRTMMAARLTSSRSRNPHAQQH